LSYEDDPALFAQKQEAQLLQHLAILDPDSRLVLEKMIILLGQRPVGAEPIREEQLEQMIEELRLENKRRRRGGSVGKLLPFIRCEKAE
jgi:hypothetical protein